MAVNMVRGLFRGFWPRAHTEEPERATIAEDAGGRAAEQTQL
jgi:hypothetical protein